MNNTKLNITKLPTPHNYFYTIQKQLNRHKEVINLSRIIILLLLLWNIIITVALLIQPKELKQPPLFNDIQQNKVLMELEELPPIENLT